MFRQPRVQDDQSLALARVGHGGYDKLPVRCIIVVVVDGLSQQRITQHLANHLFDPQVGHHLTADLGKSALAPSDGDEAFRWTEADVMAGLGDLSGGDYYSFAKGVSGDGSVIVGLSQSTNGIEAFRWTEADGMAGLGFLDGGSNSRATGVSGDGSIVVGYSSKVFIWQDGQMQSMRNYLIDNGVDMNGWILYEATAISADGSTIVGNGSHNSRDEAWVVTIPEPGTMLLTGFGAVWLGRFRRKGQALRA